MAPLVLGSEGRHRVGFNLHLRAPDPHRRASGRPVIPETNGGRAECSTWIQLPLRADRLPILGAEETVRVEPASRLRPEDGPLLRRCVRKALSVLPTTFVCEPLDREDLADDDPYTLFAFLEIPSYEALVAVFGYFVLGFDADYPFRRDDPDRASVRDLVGGLSDLPTLGRPS